MPKLSGTASGLLVEARRAAGLSQAALARKARIPRSVLNAYEREHRQPGADALASILAAAGFVLRAIPRVDRERNARVLAEVLDLAERLPWRPRRKLRYPPFHRRVA
jgi:transcriptional regulator with XRE-family HTH domain